MGEEEQQEDALSCPAPIIESPNMGEVQEQPGEDASASVVIKSLNLGAEEEQTEGTNKTRFQQRKQQLQNHQEWHAGICQHTIRRRAT